MLDIEKAFQTDNHQTLLLAEQEMPAELLDDAYKLFWEALEKRKYKVSLFLMRKPYFSPFLKNKPENWLSLVCRMPELVGVACEQHIEASRIVPKDAISLIKAALKIRFVSEKGIKHFIANFAYEDIRDNAHYQCEDLLGRLLAEKMWYWAKELMEWGVKPSAAAIKVWTKRGLGLEPFLMNAQNIAQNNQRAKAIWGDKALGEYKSLLIREIYKAGEALSEDIIRSNNPNALLFLLKVLSNNPARKKTFILSIAKACLDMPRSEVSNYVVERIPKALLAVFEPSEEWLKKGTRNKAKGQPLDRLILKDKKQELQRYALNLLSDTGDLSLDSFLKLAARTSPHIAKYALVAKAEAEGIEVLMPLVTRKEQIDTLLWGGFDPFTLMTLSNKDSHQAYLMNKLAEI